MDALKVWVPCYECDEEGAVENECFEDTCCCADPEEEHGSRVCPICHGEGGWYSSPDGERTFEYSVSNPPPEVDNSPSEIHFDEEAKP